MSISTIYQSAVTTVETLSVVSADSAKSKITHAKWDSSVTLDGTTTPVASQFVAFTQALTSGAATVDLTSLAVAPFSTKSLSGLKVQVIKFVAHADNANPITITFGAANPYQGLGTAFNITLSAGQEMTFYGDGAAQSVASGHKNLDLSGTGSQSLDIIIVAG